ncbi:MAG: ribosome biogenesis GTPase Der [Acholeplasmatales bacterium]|jgi:GTP-binding protein|nr:ribosome biogenesis GTPase Der [Acholeplasmataceae bacterium]MDY0115199.1 ribosome biogenesis GTPase Der [Acholeplasmatales bacterium]MCK9233672.1 ribosome biogenesis GTPase Der [Acholeplasmataceae bacterium]MCK9288939.1 ribosome biogenesis GTPase Der [Acholeplasmataceae bacterium]MCK9427533.1 ribosome biogenesis GTPase Der [Acholeplasmataceae bacterium]
MPFTVAIVGKPNVGKSSLFNRLIGERKAITDDKPGVTRDRIYGIASWLTKKFAIIDTGGIEIGDAPFLEQIHQQALLAIEESDLVLFVLDGRIGIDEADELIRKTLYQTNKPVLLVVNKIDSMEMMAESYQFYSLGLGDPIPISTHHGIGIGNLLDKIVFEMKDFKEPAREDSVKLAVIGYPNVGKSTLVNTILGEERVITSNIPGTTRDAVDTTFIRNNKKYTIIDTAGIKRRGRIYESTDKYALLRALKAIDSADVVLLVLDGSRAIINQDKHVAGLILEYLKACVIVVNKWDLVLKDTKTMKEKEEEVLEEFKFLSFSDVCFVSSLKNERIETIFKSIDVAFENYQRKLKTSVLNEFLLEATTITPPKLFNKGTARFSYITQTTIKPPTFVIWVNNLNYLHFSYQRYLENEIRKAFLFKGTPLNIIYKKKVD